MPAPRKGRSGTSRTYTERARAGRPNVTFSLPVEAVAAIERLAAHHKLSKSAVVALAVSELEKKIRRPLARYVPRGYSLVMTATRLEAADYVEEVGS